MRVRVCVCVCVCVSVCARVCVCVYVRVRWWKGTVWLLPVGSAHIRPTRARALVFKCVAKVTDDWALHTSYGTVFQERSLQSIDVRHCILPCHFSAHTIAWCLVVSNKLQSILNVIRNGLRLLSCIVSGLHIFIAPVFSTVTKTSILLAR